METTFIPPAPTLPACVSSCGVLYDVNGACVPPAAPTAEPSVYESCFCNDPRLAAFKTSANGVCDAACPNPADLTSIQGWFTSFCNNADDGNTAPTASASSRPAKNSGGQTWYGAPLVPLLGDYATSVAESVDYLMAADPPFPPGRALSSTTGPSVLTARAFSRLEGHYQWIIFLVIMVVAIVGIWVGACVWRRRYLRKKDRAYALNTNLAHTTGSGRVVPNAGSSAGSVHVPGAGFFDPAPISSAAVYGEKPKKKKWTLKKRT